MSSFLPVCHVRVKPECLHVQILEMFSLQYFATKDRCSCGAGEISCGFIIGFCVMQALHIAALLELDGISHMRKSFSGHALSPES